MDLGPFGNTLGKVGFSAAGGYFYGYPGMMMGMSIAGLLFHGDEAKQHNPYNDSSKNTNVLTKADPLPLLIGTDICPGFIDYLEEGTPTIVSTDFYDNEGLDDWVSSLQTSGGFFGLDGTPSIDIQLCHINFAASFCDAYYWSGYLNQAWLDKKHHWMWLRFNDFIHNWFGWHRNGWTDIQTFSFVADSTYRRVTMQLWGAFTVPQSQNLLLESFNSIPEQYRGYSVVGSMPLSFPDIKAEISFNTFFTTFNGYSGRSHTGYSHNYRDINSHYMYGIFDASWQGGYSFRRLNYYEHTYTELISPSNFNDNISIGFHDSQQISRQDIDSNPDHLYFFHGRNWYDGSKLNHHHAEYSLEYDFFYLDRSDDTLHSICKDQRLSVIGIDEDSNAVPRIQIRSMELTDDSILLFGQEWQTHSIWEEERVLTSDPEIISGQRTRIYADFSQYPNDYWVDSTGNVHVWAYFLWTSNSRDKNERYRVITQTATYIEVEGVFALVQSGTIYATGSNKIYLTRIRNYQAGWAIVGEGSTKSVIIANFPSPNDVSVPISAMPYDSCVLNESNINGPVLQWGFEISSVGGGTAIYLADTLPNDPIPGEIIWFSHEWFSGDDKDFYQNFYDPINYWFMDNLQPLMCPDWTINSPSICGDFYIYTRYSNNGVWNKNNWGKQVILRFNKSTGEFLGKIYEHNPFPFRYTGTQFIAVVEFYQISTVSTDFQIACSFQCAQPYTNLYNDHIIINKSGLSISSSWMGRNDEASSWAAGKVYRGAVKVRAYDSILSAYSNRWYVLAVEFSPTTILGEIDNSNAGFYLLDLGADGIFPSADEILIPGESAEFSSILNIDASISGRLKWFRPGVSVGPLYSYFYVGSQSTFVDSYSLKMFDYDEKLIFCIDRGSYIGLISEVWCFHMPNEHNRYGFSWPVNGSADWGDIARSCKYGVSLGWGKYSNYVDQRIFTAIDNIDLYFTSGNIDMSSDQQDYVNEIIEDIVIFNSKEHEIQEPRFLYSRCWDSRVPAYEIISDILATCQGYLVPNCSKYARVIVKIPMPNEIPVWYFGYHTETFSITSSESTVSRIYLDLSSYDINYWRGDEGVLIQGDMEYSFYVEEQTQDYIELLSSLSVTPQMGNSVRIVKDNILERSFTYAKKPQYGRSNRVRIEFINRLLGYTLDIAEVDDHYRQDVLDQCVLIKQMELHGIKRASQAARMACRYLDYEQYVNWLCSFSTDVLGHYVCVGDIIGVTHPVTSWLSKYFRIVRKEETDEFETIIECEEYISSVYHDASVPVYQGGSGVANGLTVTDAPAQVRRVSAYFNSATNRIYISFGASSDTSNVVGVNVYAKLDDGEYFNIGFSATSGSSVVYSAYPGTTTTSEMESTRTKYNEINEIGYQYSEIPYDPLTMLGTFPAAGYLWVNGELIYYNGIDTVNSKFINCVRCIDVPEYQYAADAPDDGLNWTNPLIVLADFNNQFYFNPSDYWIDLSDEALQTEGSQIEYNIPTLTIRLVSVNITGVESDLATAPTFSMQLRSAMGRPYSVALPRYERDV